jgi:hypothetical protein
VPPSFANKRATCEPNAAIRAGNERGSTLQFPGHDLRPLSHSVRWITRNLIQLLAESAVNIPRTIGKRIDPRMSSRGPSRQTICRFRIRRSSLMMHVVYPSIGEYCPARALASPGLCAGLIGLGSTERATEALQDSRTRRR